MVSSVRGGFCFAALFTKGPATTLFCSLRYIVLPFDFVSLPAVSSVTVGFCIAA
jgi:hypothetical protein